MPKNKKSKAASSSSDSDSGPEDRNVPAPKKSKTSNTTAASEEPEKKEWVLEKLRMVRINEFRGRKMVDIREFYEKDAKILPGKKGISLSATQWRKLVEVASDVTKALEE